MIDLAKTEYGIDIKKLWIQIVTILSKINSVTALSYSLSKKPSGLLQGYWI